MVVLSHKARDMKYLVFFLILALGQSVCVCSTPWSSSSFSESPSSSSSASVSDSSSSSASLSDSSSSSASVSASSSSSASVSDSSSSSASVSDSSSSSASVSDSSSSSVSVSDSSSPSASVSDSSSSSASVSDSSSSSASVSASSSSSASVSASSSSSVSVSDSSSSSASVSASTSSSTSISASTCSCYYTTSASSRSASMSDSSSSSASMSDSSSSSASVSDSTSSSSSASLSESSSSSVSASESPPSSSASASSSISSSSSASVSESSSSSASVSVSSSSSTSLSNSVSSSSSASVSESSSSSASVSPSESSSSSASVSVSSSSSASMSVSSSSSASMSVSSSSSASMSESSSSSSSISDSSSSSSSMSESSSSSVSVSESESSSSSASVSVSSSSSASMSDSSSSSASMSDSSSSSASVSQSDSSSSSASVSPSSSSSASVSPSSSSSASVSPSSSSSASVSPSSSSSASVSPSSSSSASLSPSSRSSDSLSSSMSPTEPLTGSTSMTSSSQSESSVSISSTPSESIQFSSTFVPDPCNSLECLNNGECKVNLNGTAECDCAPGFIGVICDIDVDECNGTNGTSPCQNNGTCIDGINSYSCNCTAGFIGPNCSHVDPCYNTDPCKNDGECYVADDYSFFCVCPIPKAYNGTDCGTPIDCFWDVVYPYGEDQDDQEIEVDLVKDGGCSRVDYEDGFHFYGEKRYLLFICPDGTIRFDKPFVLNFAPVPTWDIVKFRFTIPMLFPFWSVIDREHSFCSSTQDCIFDYSNRSAVFYQVYTEGSNAPNASYILDRASQDVRNSIQQFGFFSASWVLVVTWLRLRPKVLSVKDVKEDITNTFQAVIITDGTYTFLKYHYPCGGLQWASPTFGDLFSVAGFNAADGVIDRARFPTLDGSASQGATKLSTSLQDENSIIPGVFFFRIETRTGDDDETKCRKWVKFQEVNVESLITRSILPPCPCSRAQVRLESRYFGPLIDRITRIPCFYSSISVFIAGNLVSGLLFQKCCYSRNGALVVDDVDAGSVEFIEFTLPDGVLDDFAAKRVCCHDSPNCNKFYSVRPIQNCRGYRPLVRRWFWGDPHIKTLDDKDYTFNGIGEYIMLDADADNSSFLLQARTVLAPGNLSIATVFSAGAAKEYNTSTVEVRAINESGLKLYIDGMLFAGYNNLTNVSSDIGGNLRAARKTEKCLEVTFKSGTGVQFCVDKGLMTFVVMLSDEYFNKTRGLLGTYNGNPDDDFTLPNGTVLSPNLTSSDIHYNFGLEWQITAEQSLFTYAPGENVSTFANASFEPMFVEDIVWADDATRVAAIAACDDDVACLFDAASTNDVSIGTNSKDVNVQLVKENEELANFPPEFIFVPTMIEANLGEIAFVNVTATDNNSFTFDVLNKPQGASFTSAGGVLNFTWNVTSFERVKFTFIATDEFNASVSSIPTIKMCVCENDGQCVAPELGDKLNNDSKLIVQGCTCASGYTGRFCENDIDACTFNGNPCFTGVNCTDIPAPANITGFSCGPCPSGYSGDGKECTDIDECSNNTLNNCEQKCVNSLGSFSCECKPGFSLNSNGYSCDDINECQPTSDCMHQCNNTEGSYHCYCNDYFKVNTSDPKSCTPITECPSNDCDQVCFIRQDDNSQACDCNAGYELESDGKTCKDIDECQIDDIKCTQLCRDYDGGYDCECYPGFNLEADSFTCTDINECLDPNLYSCPGQFRVCANIPGDYNCECQSGLLYINNTCQALLPDEEPPDPTVPVPKEASDNEEQNSVEIQMPNMALSEYTAAVDLKFRETCASQADNYCQDNKDQCGITSKRRRRSTQLITADNVHLLPGFPVEENSALRVAFYILLPSFLQSSGIIPAAALAQVVNDAKSDLQTVLGFPISEIKLTHVATTVPATPGPTNVTNVTTSQQPQTTGQATTVTTTEKTNDDWKWIVIGVVVGVVVIVIIILVVYFVIRKKSTKVGTISADGESGQNLTEENSNRRDQGHPMATFHMEQGNASSMA